MKPASHSAVFSRQIRRRGFALYELLVTLVVLLVLGILFWVSCSVWGKWKKGSSLAACGDNLTRLGRAVQSYSRDNRERLPIAGVKYSERNRWSWDDFLNPQLGLHWNDNQLASSYPGVDVKILQCPEDDLTAIHPYFGKAGGRRRSYAMPGHDMAPANWPPSPENKAGVGIRYWDEPELQGARPQRAESIAGAARLLSDQPKGAELPAFTLSMILQPGTTIAITERVHPDNVIGNILASIIPSATEHIYYKLPIDPLEFHKGRFNYLFLDGHVEWLEPLQTLGPGNPSPSIQSGMWTVNPND